MLTEFTYKQCLLYSALLPLDKTHPYHQPGPGDKDKTNEAFSGEMKKLKDMLEGEWGRRELEITQRFQRELSALRETGKSPH